MSYKDRTFIRSADNIATFVDKANDTIQKVGDLNNLSASVLVDSDLVSAINSIADSVGTGTLNTTAQTIKGAINEHETDIGNMTFTGLSATNISAAIRELRTELGDHTALTTTATNNVVAAINEINSELYTSPDGSGSDFTTDATTIEGAINEMDARLDSDTTNIQTLNRNRDSNAALIGNAAFDTTASTITGAINELDSDIGEITDLSDSVRENVSTSVNAINYVWNYAKQIDNNQTSSSNILGNLSTLDDQIERSSFALSINALRDSTNTNIQALVDSTNTNIRALVDSTNKIGVETQSGLSYNSTTRKFKIDSSSGFFAGAVQDQLANIDGRSDTITFKNGANTFASFSRYQDSDLLISAGDANSSSLIIGDSSVTVNGNLRVRGTTTYVNTETIQLDDNILELNSNLTGNPTATDDGGLEINRGSYTNVQLIWDESLERWVAAYDSDNNLSPIVTNANLSVEEGGAGTKVLAWNGSVISHRTASPTDLSQNNSNLTFIQDISLTFDSHGHATASSVATGTITPGTYLSNSGTTINHDNTTRQIQPLEVLHYLLEAHLLQYRQLVLIPRVT
jgi:hypothetical protein